MSKDIKSNLKHVQSEVTVECMKKLKILSIQKDLTVKQLIQEILEKHVVTRKVSTSDLLESTEV